MLKIICSNSYMEERKYIYSVIFREFMGIEYIVQFVDSCKEKIILLINDKEIILQDKLFSISSEQWLKEKTLPVIPLLTMDPSTIFPHYKGEVPLPIIYGEKIHPDFFYKNEGKTYLDIDIFGSCFFMLTRYEELVLNRCDRYDRFLYQESIAYKAGFLNRPIVNEYVELLWCAIKGYAPDWQRKNRAFRVIPTHDIDKPFGMMYDSVKQISRHFAGDLLIRKNIASVFNRIKGLWNVIFFKQHVIEEAKKTFEFIFDLSEKYGLRDMFFFMNSRKSWMDGNYTVNEPEVQKLIQEVISKGHMVGLHPSFVSYKDANHIFLETESMRAVLRDLDLPDITGARQHYLRWSNPETWQSYEDAGIPIDTTLSYAGHIGFRSGTCYAHSVYNLISRTHLKLKELPLVIMDGTLFEYMRLDKKKAMDESLELAFRCRRYQGDFVILWHNTTLDNLLEREFYHDLIYRVCGDNK